MTARQIYTGLAVITFFCILTAQVFWSTIHGDGAVYAWVTRQITESGIFFTQPPKWTQLDIFAEHPYLFFYFSVPFTHFFGFSDLVLKLPNFFVATLSLYTIYRISLQRSVMQADSYKVGLTACYALIFNAVYTLQVSQPTLDPLAHLLALLSVVCLIYKRNYFVAGLLLGLAFLTKGLEMLPHLATFSLLSLYVQWHDFRAFVKNYLLSLMGLFIPVAAWIGYDFFVWDSQWISTYWFRQFTNRLLSATNMQKFFDLAYAETFFKTYILEIIIFSFGLLKMNKAALKKDYLMIYFGIYIFFNLLAFTIIKKDSNQHMTGVLLFGSIFIGEFLWSMLRSYNSQIMNKIPFAICAMAIVYWSSFIVFKERNQDIWSAIRRESVLNSQLNQNIPIVIRDNTSDSYGLFFTTQWYFPEHKVYSHEEAKLLFKGQEVLMVEDKSGKFLMTKAVYQPGFM